MSTLTASSRKGGPSPSRAGRRATPTPTPMAPASFRAPSFRAPSFRTPFSRAAPRTRGEAAGARSGVGGGAGRRVPCDCIRARAYEIFAARSANGARGDAVSDWLRAERELTSAGVGVGGAGRVGDAWGAAPDQLDPPIDVEVIAARHAMLGLEPARRLAPDRARARGRTP